MLQWIDLFLIFLRVAVDDIILHISGGSLYSHWKEDSVDNIEPGQGEACCVGKKKEAVCGK